MTIPLPFDIKSFHRDELLEEALEVIRYADVSMGKTPPQTLKEKQTHAVDILKKLQQETAKFSPKLDLRLITIKDFKERNIEPNHELKLKMKDNNFYEIKIPITLFPKSGWAFTRLECWLEFCPDEKNIHQRPIIYEIFPEDIWTEILRFQDNLSLGLNENLAFRTEIEKIEGQWEKLSSQAQGKVFVKAENKAHLVIGPFSYHLRRAEVMSRGRLDVECFWRLDGDKYVAQEDVLLRLVLKVPKNREKPINAKGVLKAYHDFQIWTSDIFKDWIPQFSDILKSWLHQGAFISYEEKWEDIIN